MAKGVKHQQHLKSSTSSIKILDKASLIDRFEEWLRINDKKVFYTLLILSTIFSLLLFNARVSDGGDDSSYIERAWLLLNEGKFPYFQGPGYPVFLSFFVKLFGLNVVALKFFSIVCQFGFVWFMYKAFHKRIPFTVLFALISFISFNHYIQYYASQTFTETFFLFLQALCLYITFKIVDSVNREDSWVEALKKNYINWILFGFMFVMLSLSKSIAFACIVGVVGYFILNKNFKQAVYAILFFAAIRILYQVIIGGIFGPSESDQFEMMLRKELYKPGLGHENFSGLITRFINNFNLYVSVHSYRILNLRAASANATKIIPALSFISSIVLGIFMFMAYKKNKFVFLSGIYFIVLCCGIFFGVQAANMQDRLIIIAMPLIFLVLFYGAFELAKKSAMAQSSILVFSVVMLFVTIGKSTVIATQNLKTLKKNMAGDIYYGFTPDWENFLKMSKYCADSLPEGTQVLSRKPNMSFIYGNGKKFVGQYWVSTVNPDSVLLTWGKQNITYVLLPSLRMNPEKNNGKVINTIHRMLGPVAQKYPQKVKLIKSIGTLEKCDLYKITYK